jgi:outer membrane protein insertion porin family
MAAPSMTRASRALTLTSLFQRTVEYILKSVKNLYSQGFFSDISIKQSAKNVIIIKIEENPVIRKITIEGSKKLKAATIKKELQVKEGNIYS